MDRNVVEEDPSGGLFVPSADQGPALGDLDHDGHPMELVVPGVEDVATHSQ